MAYIHKSTNLILLILLIACSNANAQRWDWAQKIGNNKSDKVTCIKTDSAGYIYVSGYFGNTITIGTNNLIINNTANTNSKEIFLAKLDSTGFCYWGKSGGNYFDDRVLGMDVDADGNSTIVGTFWSSPTTINGNVINTNGQGGDNGFVAKHDKNGNYLWGTFIASNTGDDQALDVAVDKFGNNYVVGFMTGNNLFCGTNAGGGATATNTNTGWQKHAYWITKLNKNGTFQWAKTFGNLPYDTAVGKYLERDIAVCVDDTSNVYITGGFDHTWPFGTGTLTSSGAYDIFTMKYDSTGNFKWATSGGSRKDDWANGITHDKNGHVYIVGEHRDSLIYDTVIVKNYDARDVYVLKLDDQTGKPIWGARAGSALGGERGNDVYADNKCNVYVTGDINGVAKFGDNISTSGGKSVQAFVAKITPEGKWTWVVTGGGTDSNDRGNAICKGKNAQIYTGGFFRTPATYGTFGPFTSNGASDGFFARLHDSLVDVSNAFKFIKPTDTLYCIGDSTIVNLPENSSYTFAPSTNVVVNATNNKLTITPNATTTYTLTGIGKGLCPSFDTLIFTITIAPQPVANFVTNPPVVLLQSPVLNLQNTSTGNNTYQWFYNNAPFGIFTDSTFNLNTEGQHCYTMVATTNYGCVDTAVNCAKVIFLESVYIPNSFTPNKDGKNDVFAPILQNIDKTKINNYKFFIANRLGQIVFETTDPNKTWDGTFNNEALPMDTYYYHCTFTSPQVAKNLFQGDVIIIR